MRLILLLPFIVSCAGNWSDFNYGPGDYLNENNIGTWDTMYNYIKFVEPEIFIWATDDAAELVAACGSTFVDGCAALNLRANTCHIWVKSRSGPSLLDHERRHCHGWTHHETDYSQWYTYSESRKVTEANLTSVWVPMPEF